MRRGLMSLAALAGLIAYGLGAWPISLLVAVYLVLSIWRARAGSAAPCDRPFPSQPGGKWGIYAVAATALLISGIAHGAGGKLSPIVFLLAGLFVILLPSLGHGALAGQVVPMRESILLRSRFLPFRWYALAEIKLESQDQTRGLSSLDGEVLIFAGKSPSAIKVLRVAAIRHAEAEEKVLTTLRDETRMLSQRGAHVLPLDSEEASRKISLRLVRLGIRVEHVKVVATLPFDLIAAQISGGLLVKGRAFRIEGYGGSPSVPQADVTPWRRPLFAELVEEIAEKH
ncbi:MAG TPA: hypothetical protein VJR06_09685, partial [Nitrososphaerales archaeon]|nr:hypothetical protein [Nitrososphaerales archaeon]